MNDLTKGRESTVILKFTVPILIGNIFQQFYNIVDSIIVGRYLGEESLAAVSASFNIINIILLVVLGFTLGTNLLIARYFGAKDMVNVKKAIDTSYVMTFAFSMFITIGGLIFINPLLNFFKIPNEIVSQSKSYLIILLCGTIFSFAYNNLSSIFRGLGNSKTPLYFLILSTLLNITLDTIFICYFHFGSDSAALATIVSQIICFFGCFLYFNHTYKEFKFNIRKIIFDKNILYESFNIGLPAAIQKLLISLGFVVIQILTNSFGSATIAAFAVASKLDSFAQIPSANLSDALSVFTAQNIGAGKYNRINKGYKSTLVISTVLCTFISIIFICFSSQLMNLFVNDIEIIALGEKYIKFVSIFYILYSFMMITNGVLIGYGNTIMPLIGTIVSFICVQVPLSIIFSHIIGSSGIYASIPLGWGSGLLIRIYFYKKLRSSYIEKCIQ